MVVFVRRLALIGSVALAGVTLAGCGTSTVTTSSFTGPARSVAQTISDFQNDGETHNDSKLCEQDLATAIVDKLASPGRTCATVISKQLNEVDTFDLSLVTVRVNDATSPPTATARVKDTRNGVSHMDTLTLVKEGSRWKISGLIG